MFQMILILIVIIFPPGSLNLPVSNKNNYAVEIIENSVNSSKILDRTEDVEVLEGDYAANQTKPRDARHSHSHSYGGGSHHSYSGHHHIGGYSGIHHHHHYYGGSSSPSYYGGSGYYGGYYGGYGYGYGYGYGNNYYGYGNGYYYGANQGLVNLCLGWAWGCSITNYRA